MLSPSKSIKHYLNIPAGVVSSGAKSETNIVVAIAEGAARSLAVNVEEGCTIKAVFVEMWLSGVTADKTANWMIVKRPSGVAGPTFTEMNNMGTYPNKKNILISGQGLMPTGGNVVPILRQWIKIPKGKQRFGIADVLSFEIAATGTSVNVCGLVTFKEYN